MVTVGYEGRSVDDLIDGLHAAAVKSLSTFGLRQIGPIQALHIQAHMPVKHIVNRITESPVPP